MSQASVKKKLATVVWQEKFGIDCYGEALDFRLDDKRLKQRLIEVLPVIGQVTEFKDSNNVLSLVTNQNVELNGLYLNDDVAMEFERLDENNIEDLADKILIVLAKISLPRKFYLHAGAVVWNGFGVLIPGASYSGKTTLVKELIEAGAEYYSDDCIILENDGYMLPLPRPLAIRTDAGRLIKGAAEFGAKIGRTKAKLDVILFTGYEESAVWNPQQLSAGQTVLELLNNFYYKGSISDVPREIISSLTRITGQTKVILNGRRDEASEVVRWVEETFGKSINA